MSLALEMRSRSLDAQRQVAKSKVPVDVVNRILTEIGNSADLGQNVVRIESPLLCGAGPDVVGDWLAIKNWLERENFEVFWNGRPIDDVVISWYGKE